MTSRRRTVLVLAVICAFPFVVGLGITAFAASQLFSRSKEVARVELHAPGEGATTFGAREGDRLELWTSFDVEYDGEAKAGYDVRLVQDGAPDQTAGCNPWDPSLKMNGRTLELNDHVKTSYQGRMRCELTVARTGPAKLLARLATSDNLQVHDMSLVVKR